MKQVRKLQTCHRKKRKVSPLTLKRVKGLFVSENMVEKDTKPPPALYVEKTHKITQENNT